VGVGTVAGAGAEADFSENHHIPQRPFGLIVGELSIRLFEEGKQLMVFLLGIEQSFS
jgi:hypothetical protein